MRVFEFTFGGLNDVGILVNANADDPYAIELFDVDGKPLKWTQPPRVKVFVGPRRKKPKPRVDISYLATGAVVLSAKAKTVLGDFLSKFGQLLELDCEGHPEYFYNVTNLVSCIDPDRSELRPEGGIEKEAFIEKKLPKNPAIFKDPMMAMSRIYANEGAKDILDSLIREAGITGAEFIEIVSNADN